MNRPGKVVGAVVAALMASSAAAQVDLERFERQLEQIQRDTQLRVDTSVPPDQRVLIEYGGYLTFSFVTIDDPAQNTHYLRQTDLNGYLRVNLDGVHEFYVRGRTTYRDFNSGDSFDGAGDDWVEPTLDRGYYRFDMKRWKEAYEGESPDYNLVIQAGRQLVHWANGLTLSQELDGGVFELASGVFQLDLLAARTRPSNTDIDSSRPGFDNEMDRQFFGAMLSVQVDPRHRPYIYALYQQDANDNVARVDVPAIGPPITTLYEYNSFYIGAGSRGSFGSNWVYGVELVYQGGETLSSPFTISPGGFLIPAAAQTNDDIEAFAADFQLDYLFNDAKRTRLGGEVLLATGDSDRVLHTTNTFGGNAPGTTDNAFNAFGLLNTGYAFAPSASNLLMLRVGGSTFPLPNSPRLRRLQIGSNIFFFAKLDGDAPFDEDTSNDTYLGTEIDVFVNWQITSDVAIAVRYGVFFPGDAIGGIFVPTDHQARHFFYTGITFSF